MTVDLHYALLALADVAMNFVALLSFRIATQ